jgi:hypothetical protein
MSRYGLNYYYEAYYGTDNPIKFDATPFTATPSNYGSILLNWVDPGGSWSQLVITRNSYGFPVNPYDGIQVLTVNNGADPVSYIDSTSLAQGQFYYYTIFVYNLTQYAWNSAGTAMGLSVKNYGNTTKLYNYLPEIYKISTPYSPSSDWSNSDLYSFLSNFGFQLDYEQTLIDLLVNKYNITAVSGKLIPTMLNQFGQTYEPAIGLEQNRILLRDSVTLTKQKGSKQGLSAYIKDFTGWGIPVPISGTPNPSTNGIVIGHNLMLDYNDSSFEEGPGQWISSDGSADIDQLDSLNIQSVSLTSNVATLVIGPHYYDVGNTITISGLPYPLFNTATPVTLTAVDQTNTISFALVGTNLISSSGYSASTGAYGIVTPYPAPWVEPTAPTLFPNKSTGILALYNTSASTQTITAYCGDDAPITKGVPVTAATTYTFSIYIAKGATARSVTPQIKWFTRFGIYISTSSGSAVTNTSAVFSSSYRPYVSAAAPAGAYYACPGVSIASVGGTATNEHHYFDAAQFEAASSPTSFDDARNLHLTLRANRINELINPHFASPITPWTVTGASSTIDTTIQEPQVSVYSVASTTILSNTATVTLSTPHILKVGSSVILSGITGSGVTAANYNGARTITAVTITSFSFAVTATNQSTTNTTGTAWGAGNALKLTSTGTSVAVKSWDGSTTSQLMGIYYPNTSYTFSVYAKTASTTETVTVKINWYNISNTLISSSIGTSTTVTSTTWARPYVTGTAPATAAYATVEFNWTTTSGNVLSLDEALFENNGQVLSYFDGSNGQAISTDLLWEGGVLNGSRSHYYKNRYITQTRLYTAVLANQLILGSTAAVYIAQPQT